MNSMSGLKLMKGMILKMLLDYQFYFAGWQSLVGLGKKQVFVIYVVLYGW